MENIPLQTETWKLGSIRTFPHPFDAAPWIAPAATSLELRTALRGLAPAGDLQRLRGVLPFRGGRRGACRLQGEGDLVRARGRPGRRHRRPRALQAHRGPGAAALPRLLRLALRLRRNRDGDHVEARV